MRPLILLTVFAGLAASAPLQLAKPSKPSLTSQTIEKGGSKHISPTSQTFLLSDHISDHIPESEDQKLTWAFVVAFF
jgi:hypothetical protein